MKSRLEGLFYTQNTNNTITAQVITTDNEMKRVVLPIDLIEELTHGIKEDGEVPLLFKDNTYLMIKGILLGSSDLWKEERIIFIGGDRH